MTIIGNKVKHILIAITCLVFWVMLWQFPWQKWIGELRWIQVVIGMILFILPGSMVTYLHSKKPQNWIGIILYGFVISITIVSLFGVLARVFQLSFAFIYNSLFVIGSIYLVYLSLSKNLLGSIKLDRSINFTWTILLLIPLLISIYIAAKVAIPPLIHDDDLSYNALLAYYRYSNSLTFSDTVTHISRVRFWLAFWPLVEAVIAKLCGMSGLLLTGVYVSPVLVVISSLSIYHLGKTLQLRREFIIVGIIAQIASLIRLTGSSQPGIAFFNLFPQDKNVAFFVIAPIIFSQTISYLKNPTRNKVVFLILTIMGLGFTHPTVLGITALICAIYAMVNMAVTKKWKSTLILVLIFIIVMIPHFSLRFFEEEGRRVYTVESDVETIRDYKINPHRIRVLDNTQFYGISPEVIDAIPFTVLIFVGIFSISQITKSSASRFFLSILIVLGIILFPYTGWLLGLAITPFHLWRIPRLFPFGLSMAYLLEWITNQGWKRFEFLQNHEKPLHDLVLIISSLAFLAGTLYILPWSLGNLGGRKPGFDLWYEQYIEIGDYLNSVDKDDIVIVGGPDTITNDIIPSLVVDANLISFRNENPGPNTEIWESLVSEETDNTMRYGSLKKYGVNYILIREDAEWIKKMQTSYPGEFSLEIQNKKLSLYEFKP